jgi:hypothetical protein
MTTRIGSQIFRGELFNRKRNSTHGWIDFGDDWGVRLELTGNMSGELAGTYIRFQSPRPTSDADCSREVVDALADFQHGVTGEIEVRTAADGSRTLYLEWFSQNGQVIAEIADPILDFGPFEEDEKPTITSLEIEISNEPPEETEGDDPFDLFPPDLEQQLSAAGEEAEVDEDDFEAETDWEEDSSEFAGEMSEQAPQLRPWDEVIPGIDPETKRMYEEWDEVIYGTKDVPFTSLFDPPLTLKRPADIADEAEATGQLRILLARLALHSVVVHMCPHFTAMETYRWLLEDLLPSEGVHPRLGPIGFTRHYDTADRCPACEAEFEERWGDDLDQDE